MIEIWWPFVRTDSVLFHVILLLSALSLESLLYQKDGRYSRQLLGECVSLLSARTLDPVLGLSDQTIVAVANLATVEVILPAYLYHVLKLLKSFEHSMREETCERFECIVTGYNA